MGLTMATEKALATSITYGGPVVHFIFERRSHVFGYLERPYFVNSDRILRRAVSAALLRSPT